MAGCYRDARPVSAVRASRAAAGTPWALWLLDYNALLT